MLASSVVCRWSIGVELRLARRSRLCACTPQPVCACVYRPYQRAHSGLQPPCALEDVGKSSARRAGCSLGRASRHFSPIQEQNRELAAWSTLSYCVQSTLGVPQLEARDFRSTLGSPTAKSRQLPVSVAAPQPGSFKSALAHSTAGQDGLHQLPACWDGWRAVHRAKRCKPLHWWRPQGLV
jgi:hypothetical protein